MKLSAFAPLSLLCSALVTFSTTPLQAAENGNLVGPQASSDNEHMFPIWGKEARERGYVLPKTYGFSFSYMTMDQPLKINSINLSGPIAGTNNDLSSVSDALFSDHLDISDATQKAQNFTLRGDTWLFPFLNVYGLLGYTEGTSQAPIHCKPGRPTNPIGHPLALIVDQLCGTDNTTSQQVGTFDLDYQGITYGVGMTVAGGYENWFTIVDINYSRTDLDILDGHIDSLVISPRFGYRFMPQGKELRVWVGGMYQGVQQEMGGNLNQILSGQIASIVNSAVPDGKFNVEQELQAEWNTTLGFNYVLNPSWDIIGEVGLGQRTSAFVGLGYRF